MANGGGLVSARRAEAPRRKHFPSLVVSPVIELSKRARVEEVRRQVQRSSRSAMRSAVIEPGILESLRRTSSKPGAGPAAASLRRKPWTKSASSWPSPAPFASRSILRTTRSFSAKSSGCKGLEYAIPIHGIDLHGHARSEEHTSELQSP